MKRILHVALVVAVRHDLNLAAAYADRVLLIAGAKLSPSGHRKRY